MSNWSIPFCFKWYAYIDVTLNLKNEEKKILKNVKMNVKNDRENCDKNATDNNKIKFQKQEKIYKKARRKMNVENKYVTWLES